MMLRNEEWNKKRVPLATKISFSKLCMSVSRGIWRAILSTTNPNYYPFESISPISGEKCSAHPIKSTAIAT